MTCVQAFTDVFQRKNNFGNKMDRDSFNIARNCIVIVSDLIATEML